MEAIKNAKIILLLLETWKAKIQEEQIYDHDEITMINSKLFFNYYRLLNLMKKHLLRQGSNDKKEYSRTKIP